MVSGRHLASIIATSAPPPPFLCTLGYLLCLVDTPLHKPAHVALICVNAGRGCGDNPERGMSFFWCRVQKGAGETVREIVRERSTRSAATRAAAGSSAGERAAARRGEGFRRAAGPGARLAARSAAWGVRISVCRECVRQPASQPTSQPASQPAPRLASHQCKSAPRLR
mmetsp:Transcript_11443/g.21192  ORF Transcript_11443/g.21192 Transcript_11443/m.21192 type:complete len:169 (-) Transcript_11443:1771-2277(-)